jgi:prepilin peptidase CpaA
MHGFLLMATCVAAIAAVSDWRKGKIPNVLTHGVLVAAPIIHVARVVQVEGWSPNGWLVLLGSVLGALACGLVPMLLFIKGATGAGDVKLLAAMGALLGPRIGIEVAFYSFVVAGLVGPARLAYEGRLFSSIKTAALVAVRPSSKNNENAKVLVADLSARFPLGPSVLVGTIITSWLHWRSV